MACCDRKFPQPDPMMRFIDPDEGPYTFWAMEPNERSRRLRAYLVALCAGEEPIMAWLAAITEEKDDIDLIHQIVDINCGPENGGDEKIEAMMRDLRQRSLRRAWTNKPMAGQGA
jgi:hypothetical protein